MDFGLSKEHELARQLFKDFAQNEVKPLAQEVDENERFPRETVDKMAKKNGNNNGNNTPKDEGAELLEQIKNATKDAADEDVIRQIMKYVD